MSSSWVLSLGLVGVVVCTLLAANGFKGRPDTVGIDLGTTFSVIALRTEAGTDVLRDAQGRALVPSAVYFSPDGTVLVGRAAEAMQHADPQHFIYNAKRFIGRDLDDQATLDQAPSHPFKFVANATASYSGVWFGSADGKRVMTKANKDPHAGKAPLLVAVEKGVELVGKAFESKTKAYAPGGGGAGVGSTRAEQDMSVDRTSVSPETVGSHVLRHLLSIAQASLGHSQLSKAVMAVPAKFTARQRSATAEAFKQAGLRVMRIIEEPTAAALAYGLDKKPNVEYILVYDFGGGTLDVSLLFVNKESVQVIATHGDDLLGGADFDQCVARTLSDKLASRKSLGEGFLDRGCVMETTTTTTTTTATAATPEEVEDGALKKESEKEAKDAKDKEVNGSAATDFDKGGEGQKAATVALLPCSASNLRVLAERVKRDLSSSDQALASCSALNKPNGVCTEGTASVTRGEFETGAHCRGLFDRALKPVEDLLNEALMPREEIDEVVLVGGTSRVPLVRQLLKDFFGMEHLNHEIDPDLTVAIGAASIVD